MLSEIRIALPESVQISVGEAGKSRVVGAIVTSEAATRKLVAVRVAKALGGHGRAYEIALAGVIASVTPVTPCPLWIPVPRFYGQLGILAEGHRLPSRRQRPL